MKCWELFTVQRSSTKRLKMRNATQHERIQQARCKSAILRVQLNAAQTFRVYFTASTIFQLKGWLGAFVHAIRFKYQVILILAFNSRTFETAQKSNNLWMYIRTCVNNGFLWMFLSFALLSELFDKITNKQVQMPHENKCHSTYIGLALC